LNQFWRSFPVASDASVWRKEREGVEQAGLASVEWSWAGARKDGPARVEGRTRSEVCYTREKMEMEEWSGEKEKRRKVGRLEEKWPERGV
jgi:hypothetical protein